MSSGALERIVEHWLARTKERGFQVAYAQLLMSQGYQVLHLSAHTESELGKDIIALAPDGTPCGYQLKIDNISLAKWRTEVWPECEQLLSLPLVHPSLPPSRRHRSYLVTTGNLSEPVRNDLDQRNRQRRRSRQPQLEVVVRGQLVNALVAAQAAVLPWNPADYQRFFDLYGRDGRAPVPKEELSQFLISLLPFAEIPPRPRDVQEQLSRTLLMANYALEPYREAQNNWALAEGWTMVAAHLAGAAERTRLPERLWQPSVALAEEAVLAALEALWREVRETSVLSGFAISDSLIYPWRVTQLSGWLAGLCLSRRLRGTPHEEELRIVEWCAAHQADLSLASEELMPQWLAAAWLFSAAGQVLAGDGLIERAMDAVLAANVRGGYGLPNPYYSTQRVLRHQLASEYPIPNLDRIEESFRGMSFTLESLVLLAARRNLRSLLRRSWRAITHVLWSTFRPRPAWSTYLWRAEDGVRSDVFPPETQSWEALRTRANTPDSRALPAYLRTRPGFLVLFLLCYPHRLTSAAAITLDARL